MTVTCRHVDRDLTMSHAPAAQSPYAEIAAELVSAYVSNNYVALHDLPALIRSVHDVMSGLGTPAPVETAAEPLKPAVPIKRSVTDDFIISLEDGRKFKSMKRYLSGLGMTPAEYRAKWGLASDYPMVAPAYAAKRSELAKTIGLGRKAAAAATEPAPPPATEPAPAKAKRGRKAA